MVVLLLLTSPPRTQRAVVGAGARPVHPIRVVSRRRSNSVAFGAKRTFSVISHAIHHYGFQGVKVHGADALPTRELCEAVQAVGVPLLVDVVGHAEVIDMI